jgi:hypothetical protein
MGGKVTVGASFGVSADSIDHSELLDENEATRELDQVAETAYDRSWHVWFWRPWPCITEARTP